MKDNQQPVGNPDTFGKSELHDLLGELSDIVEFAAQHGIHIGASFIPSEVRVLDRGNRTTIAWYCTFPTGPDREGIYPCKTQMEMLDKVSEFVVEQAAMLKSIRLNTPIQ